eukprot:383122-Pleurochrysis_carterae.AAC.2
MGGSCSTLNVRHFIELRVTALPSRNTSDGPLNPSSAKARTTHPRPVTRSAEKMRGVSLGTTLVLAHRHRAEVVRYRHGHLSEARSLQLDAPRLLLHAPPRLLPPGPFPCLLSLFLLLFPLWPKRNLAPLDHGDARNADGRL